ncbi:hypothetical protein [Tenacibaculum sp. 190524A02b]|uniref:HMA domain-containing protein n=1 Tax=Tenacibaculum vairaonense TaxID=3137860 RepID=A0ABP1FF02_9FLAO
MKLFIFKSDVNTDQKAQSVQEIFNRDKSIIDISIDLEDVDCVLRIEADDTINETYILSKIEKIGFKCIELVD